MVRIIYVQVEGAVGIATKSTITRCDTVILCNGITVVVGLSLDCNERCVTSFSNAPSMFSNIAVFVLSN